MSDISDLDVSEATSVMEVKNNAGETMRFEDGRPFTVTLMSKDSPQVVEFMRKQADRRVATHARSNTPVLAAQVERDTIEVLAFATKSWDLIISGESPPSERAAYLQAYTRYRPLREQVEQHFEARSNFSKGT